MGFLETAFRCSHFSRYTDAIAYFNMYSYLFIP
jgi:hypothetical protein